MVIIRAVTADDHDAIRAVIRSAFPASRFDEADIVDGVRAEGAALVERVAEDAGAIVGHVLFSRMGSDAPGLIVGLGPLATVPARQGQGIGSALSRAGLAACRDLGARAAVVLGAPAYYQRFGYSAAAAAGLASPYAGLPAFMAMALVADGLAGVTRVDYPAAFG